ncbi:MAG: hypothetical protein Kow0099_00880 [Candidatus Abyssubacteria bacterium]
MDLSRTTARAGWLAFLFPFAVYVFTLCPTVYWDDSGELIAAAYTLGIPHPPGHPLYAILGKLFTFLPFGSIAWRVNFMSAFFGALASLLLYKLIVELLEGGPFKQLAALCGALFFAFAPTMWDQATVAETSTLHVFFMMLLTWLAIRIASGAVIWKTETRSLCLFSFLYGISLTNHVAGVFLLPAFGYLFLASIGRKLFMPMRLVKMFVAFLLGLSLYLYLPLRSLANPPVDWGNPETLENFIWVVTAKQFAPNLMTKPNIYVIAAHIAIRAKDLLGEFTVVGCIVGVIGAWRLARSKRRNFVFTALVIAVLFYVGFNNAFISAYFIPAMALMALWIGLGFEKTFQWAFAFWGHIRASSAMVMTKVTCGALAASFMLPLCVHYKELDRKDDVHAREYGEKLLEGLPENAAFFTTDGYALFILWYLLYCENRRPDLIVVEPTWLSYDNPLRSQVVQQYPDLVLPSEKTVSDYMMKASDPVVRQYLAIQSLLDANHEERPVYWGVISQEVPFAANLVPVGILHRYSPEPVTLDDGVLARNRQFWEAEIGRLRCDSSMAGDKIAREIYPVELNNQGMLFETLGREDLTRWAVRLALKFNPDYPVSHYNLGRLEARAGRFEEAIPHYEAAVRGNPYMAIAHFGLGNAYRSLGKYDRAFTAFRKAAQMYPEYYEAITAMGQLYSLAGQHGDAIESFQRALKISPDYPYALRGLAAAYLEMNRIDEAREMLERALAVEPGSPSGLFCLAKYYARLGETENAEKALRSSLKTGGQAFLQEAVADDDLRELAQRIGMKGGRG